MTLKLPSHLFQESSIFTILSYYMLASFLTSTLLFVVLPLNEVSLSCLLWRFVWQGHLVKNPNTQRAKSLREVPAAHRLVLSGTPLQNHLQVWHHLSSQHMQIISQIETLMYADIISLGFYLWNTQILILSCKLDILHLRLSGSTQSQGFVAEYFLEEQSWALCKFHLSILIPPFLSVGNVGSIWFLLPKSSWRPKRVSASLGSYCSQIWIW